MTPLNPNQSTPVDFAGERLNVLINRDVGKVWVCIDDVAVFRARDLKGITVDDAPSWYLPELTLEQALLLLRVYQEPPQPLGGFEAATSVASATTFQQVLTNDLLAVGYANRDDYVFLTTRGREAMELYFESHVEG
jgi:hypothetical protein